MSFHGIPLSIIPDICAQFTYCFWMSFQKGLDTQLNLSTDGQAERTIEALEDMIRACVIDFKANWDNHLPLIEFYYNNNYNLSISSAHFQALYGRRCSSPIGWFEVGESSLLGLEIIYEDLENKVIRDRFKATYSRQNDRFKVGYSRQKSNVSNRRRDLAFEIGDWV